MRILKYLSFLTAIAAALLFSGISSCIMDPCSVGEPDSLFSEYLLVWDLVDRHYACFFAKGNVDWDEIYQLYKPAAENLSNREQLNDICLDMLGEFRDQNLILHDTAGIRMEGWNQNKFVNWDITVLEDYMQRWSPPGIIITLNTYGALAFKVAPSDTLGYVYISNLGSPFSYMGFYGATNAIAGCSGTIFDLRMCGSNAGIEYNALVASGRFITEFVPAYYRAFRTGPGRCDMGEMEEVRTTRNGAWQYAEPVVLLTGRYTHGAAEQFVLLLSTQGNVTVIGDTTAGFANPSVLFNLTEDYTIEIPEMVTYTLDGTLLMNEGIPPDIYIPVSEADFTAGVDPVIDAAIDMLLQQKVIER